MNPLISSIISMVFLGIGLAAALIMLNLQGNPKNRPSPKRLKTIHRILGYLFLLYFFLNLIFMAKRLLGVSSEPSPRLILHIALALLLIPVFLVKISISRFFKKLYSFLFPLGLILFAASFLMIAVTAGYYLLSTAEFLDETDQIELQPTKEPVRESDLAKTDAKIILEQKCTICHNLDRVRKADKTEAEWATTIERMIKYTRNPNHLSRKEKRDLVRYLSSGG